MKFYSEKLIEQRKKSGFKVQRILNRLGIGRSTYWNWEHGVNIPSEKNIRDLCSILQIDVSQISDLSIAVDISDKGIFEHRIVKNSFSAGRGSELIKNQNYALGILKTTNDELNKVWAIVEAILKAVDVILYIKSIDSKYIIANNAFRKNLSLPEDLNIDGKTDYDFYSHKEAEKNYKEDQELISSGKTIIHCEGAIPGTRRKKWGLISKFPIYDSEGKIAGLIGIFDDITEKRHLEWMRELVDTALRDGNDIFTIRELNSDKFLYTSKSISRITGISEKQLLGVDGYETLLNKMDIQEKEKEKEKLYKEKENFPEKRLVRFHSIDDGIQWFECTTHKIYNNNRVFNCTIGRDITDMLSTLKENDQLYSIMNTLNNFVVWKAVVVNGNLKPLYVSGNLEKITGYPRQAFLQREITLLDLIHEKHKTIFDEWANNFHEALDVEHQIKTKDGHLIWVETRSFAKKDVNGTQTVIVTHQDITERKELEDEYREYQKVVIKKNIKEQLKEKLHNKKNIEYDQKTLRLVNDVIDDL
jgi:PAS domain S-box-containing protein